MLGSGWGELGGGKAVAAQERAAAAGGEGGSVRSCCLFCVFSLSVSLLFLFPLFAVLLNCPYPDPPVFAFLFPFSSSPHWGEGRQSDRVALCCHPGPNQDSSHPAAYIQHTLTSDCQHL